MKISSKVLRSLTAILFLLLTAAGLLWHTGWGTLSSFGWKDIALICPLGAIEVMLAEKTFIPQAFFGLAAVFLICTIFGRIFCGWVCPVPLLKRLFRKRDEVRIDEQKTREAPGAPHEEKTEGSAAVPLACAQSSPANCAMEAEPACSACTSVRKAHAETEKSSRSSGARNAGPLAVLAGALASSAVFGFPVFCLICPVGLTFALLIALWRLFEVNDLSWSIAIFAGFLFLEIFVLRRWCGNFCPLGALMTLLSRFNRTLRPTVSRACLRESKGLNCRVCATACPEGIRLTEPDGGSSHAHCTKCRRCAESCPEGAITFPLIPGKVELSDAQNPRSQRRTGAALELEKRRTTFLPAVGTLTLSEMREQSARCIECGACVRACPQHPDIPAWMALLREERVRDAALLMLEKGRLPEICGRVCPSERLCESACPVAGGAVPIASLERAAVERVLARGWEPKRPWKNFRKSVAVIGAGPAGLAAADILAQAGLRVVVCDREPAAGGLLTFGIPAFKLEKELVLRRRRMLSRMGVEFRFGTEVGRDASAAKLLEEADALFIASGAEKPVSPGIPGEEAKGVEQAKTYLAASTFRMLPEEIQKHAKAPRASAEVRGKRVVVIGSGDTAMDCLRAAIREGAASALAIARKPETQIRAIPSEVLAAREEGAKLLFEAIPQRICTDDSGSVEALEIRHAPSGEIRKIPADLILLACGFRTEPHPWISALGVRFTDKGRIEAENTRTNVPGIYAGGDAVRGAALAAEAVADGRTAAEAILSDLGLREELHHAR